VVFSGIGILRSLSPTAPLYWFPARVAKLNRNAFQHIQKRAFIDVVRMHQQAEFRVGEQHDEIRIGGL
jgi:hypothetical protein